MSTIAFIGLGNMGLPMANNLVKAGHKLQVFDTIPVQLDKAADAGMTTCLTAPLAAQDADVIITMLPNGEIVAKVYDEIIPQAKQNALLLDCSTIDVATSKAMHAKCEAANLLCIDAPVSGGIAGADGGTLTFMAGGSKQAFDAAVGLLEIMGAKHVHCGDGGSGQAAKICNNMLLAISMIGTCEAFSLADKLGLSQQAAFDVMSTSSGFCWSINNYCPVPGVGPQSPADNDYKPGFATELMVKDAGLSQQAAEAVGQATPMGARATELYRHFMENGGEGKDFSAIIEMLNTNERGTL